MTLPALLLLLAAGATACASGPNQPCETRTAADEAKAGAAAASGAAGPQVPSFPLAALRGAHSISAKLYLKPDGRFSKYAVYVAKEAIPAWVHAMADSELGQGEDLEYEVEQYENGDTTYEVTRVVAGKKVELSVHSVTKKKLYTEQKDRPLEEAPAAVRQAAAKIAGFAADAQGLEIKEYPDRTIYEVHGQLGGKPLTVLLAADGAIVERRRDMPAKLKIGL